MNNRSSVHDLKEGDLVVILLSECCTATQKGVEHGDHLACRACYKTDRIWNEYLAPFAAGDGPVYSKRRRYLDPISPRPFYWG